MPLLLTHPIILLTLQPDPMQILSPFRRWGTEIQDVHSPLPGHSFLGDSSFLSSAHILWCYCTPPPGNITERCPFALSSMCKCSTIVWNLYGLRVSFLRNRATDCWGRDGLAETWWEMDQFYSKSCQGFPLPSKPANSPGKESLWKTKDFLPAHIGKHALRACIIFYFINLRKLVLKWLGGRFFYIASYAYLKTIFSPVLTESCLNIKSLKT